MTHTTIEGSCHCGNINYHLQWPADEFPITIRECICSFCQKHGGVYTSHPDSELIINVGDQSKVINYRFGHETADFVMCADCGCLLVAICPLDGNDYAVINVNNFENVDKDQLIHSFTNFEAESLASRLGRRKQNWTPKVSFTYKS